MSMTFVLVTILGGAGTIFGPLLGALILIPLQEYSRALWGGFGGGIDLIIFGIIIVVVVVRQPRGIMGIISEVKNHFQNTKKIDFSLEKTERGE
jgi:branched-chain amino acid transport system permease protein